MIPVFRRRSIPAIGCLLAVVMGLSGVVCRAAPDLSAAQRATVRLEVVSVSPSRGRLQKHKVTGSGVVISAAGHVLTNYHVVRNAVRAKVWMADGTAWDAELLGVDPPTDLAVLRIADEALAHCAVADFADGEPLEVGGPVWALGSPANLSQAVTAGVVANPRLSLPDDSSLPKVDGERVGRLVRWILHDASIFPGNSGGPLVNASGQLVGINEISIADLGGAIPVDLAQRVIPALVSEGRVTRSWLGVEWRAWDRVVAQTDEFGVLAATIWPDGPAARAGMKSGDVVTVIDGNPVSIVSDEELVALGQREEVLPRDREVPVVVKRSGVELGFKIQPGIRPRAKAPPEEVSTLGMVGRDLTPQFVWDSLLKTSTGVWIESVRPGERLDQAKPEIKIRDVITSVAGEPVADLRELRAAVVKADAAGEPWVLGFEREGAAWLALVELATPAGSRPHSVRRGWLGIEVQAVERPLANRMGLPQSGGLRVTEVIPGSSAEKLGLVVGDVLTALDGERFSIRREQDSTLLADRLRAYRPGAAVELTIWREGTQRSLTVELEAEPLGASDMAYLDWPEAECVIREATHEDRRTVGLGVGGLVITQIAPAGWGDLAGMQEKDVLVAINGQSVETLAEVPAVLERLRAERFAGRVSVRMRRHGYENLFLQLEWNPAL